MQKAKVIKIAGLAVLAIAVVIVGVLIFPRPVMAPEEQSPSPTATESVSATAGEVEPTPSVRLAYVPDPEELQEIPSISTLELIEGYIVSSEQEGNLKVSWPAVEDADYYVLCVLDDSDEILQKDILKIEIIEWEFPDFQGASVMLLCYKDMGEDSAQDDMLIGAYVENISPAATQKPTSSTPKPASSTPKPTSSEPKNKYMIIVDKADHAFAAFTYDENGKYTKKVKEFPCALGRSSRMTPTGEFEISNKGRWKTWSGDKFSPYYTRYTSGLYFHGPIYDEKDGSTMFPDSYEEIGTNASAGCVRTTTAGAYWVYAHCPAGTIVKIVASSDLVSWPGKPAIDPNFPTWDPTDPDKPEKPEPTPTPSPSESVVPSPSESAAPSDSPSVSPSDATSPLP